MDATFRKFQYQFICPKPINEKRNETRIKLNQITCHEWTLFEMELLENENDSALSEQKGNRVLLYQ
jgi:hypothetical protein